MLTPWVIWGLISVEEDLVRFCSGTETFSKWLDPREYLLIIHGPEVNALKDTCTISYCAVLSEKEAEGIRLYKNSFALITTLTAQHFRSCIPSEPEISICCLGTQ